MQIYFAPLEGLTDSIYRRLHHKYFGGVDRYYTPFFSPTIHRCLTPREQRELPNAQLLEVQTIPQLLTKVSEDFLWMAGVCHDLGYSEVNLNLGCPSGTVTAKGKGAGMLRDPDELDRFLDQIFYYAPLPISIKTRLGMTEPEEFTRLLDIFNQYPVAELIVHPRLRKDFYNSELKMDAFQFAVQSSKCPVCFNGNLCSKAAIDDFAQAYPTVNALMLGRGLIGDPGMLTPEGTTADKLEGFLDELLEQYAQAFGGYRNAMFRLKENWRYLFCLFPQDTKLQKQLRKTTDVQQYRQITAAILHTLPIQKTLTPDW